jgi:hypothetical protein
MKEPKGKFEIYLFYGLKIFGLMGDILGNIAQIISSKVKVAFDQIFDHSKTGEIDWNPCPELDDLQCQHP